MPGAALEDYCEEAVSLLRGPADPASADAMREDGQLLR